MNRFKFRAWDDKNKKWLLGYDMPNLGGFSLFGESILTGQWESVCCPFIFQQDGKKFDDLKVMQFTGITINGRELYEDDVYRLSQDEIAHLRIVWDTNRSGWDYMRLEDGAMMWEHYEWGLIEDSVYAGSIYENPELLEL